MYFCSSDIAKIIYYIFLIMVSSNIENLGGGWGGWGNGFGGGAGILGIIALLGILRGRIGEGEFRGAENCCCEIQEAIGDLKGQIGENTLKACESNFNTVLTLLQEINAGRVENMSALLSQTNALQAEMFGIQKDILTSSCKTDAAIASSTFAISRQLDQNAAAAAACCCETNLNIERQGFANQIATINQTNQLSKQISDCCCETNLNIERQGFAIQLRDLENQNENNKNFAKLECGQAAILAKMDTERLLDENVRLRDKVEALREREERQQACCLNNKTNTLIKELGDAQRVYAALNTPTVPFPWDIPVNTVSCCCC